MHRKSIAKGSLDNVLTVLANCFGIDYHKYDIHVKISRGVPIDGPSAGVTMAVAIYSAIYNISIDNRVAMTGEISLHGLVRPVGGVNTKIAAAKQAGAQKVFIPKENWQETYSKMGINIVTVESLQQVLDNSLIRNGETVEWEVLAPQT